MTGPSASTFTVEFLADGDSHCALLLHQGEDGLGTTLVDAGSRRLYERELRRRLDQLRWGHDRGGECLILDTLIITQRSARDLGGAIALLREIDRAEQEGRPAPVFIREIWFDSGAVARAARAFRLFRKRGGRRSIQPWWDGRDAAAAEELVSLALKLRIPLNPWFFGEGPTGVWLEDWGTVSFTVVAPTRQRLEASASALTDWQSQVQANHSTAELVSGWSRVMEETPSGIAFLAHAPGKRVLFTGEARSRDIMEGIQRTFGPETLHVDSVVLPRRVDSQLGDLIGSVAAYQYVLPGDPDEDPEARAILQLLGARAPVQEIAVHLLHDPRVRSEPEPRQPAVRRVEPQEASKAVSRVVRSRDERIVEDFDAPVTEIGETRSADDLRDPRVMHRAFGSEKRTEPWVSMLRLVDATTGENLSPDRVRLRGGRSSDRRNIAWIDLDVPPGLGKSIWLSLDKSGWPGDPGEAVSLAVLLPHDLAIDVPVRLEIGFAESEDTWQFLPNRLSARIAPPRPRSDQAEIWSQICRAQERAALFSSLEAGRIVDADQPALVAAVMSKRSSPLAATVAAAILIGGNVLDTLRDWPRNLANWFPQLADGPVLWAELLLRRQRRAIVPPLLSGSAASDPSFVSGAREWLRREDTSAALDMFLALEKRGPPLLAASLAMAAGQARLWTRQSSVMDTDVRKRIKRIGRMIDSMTEQAEPSSVFLSFRSSLPDFAPPAALAHAEAAAGA